MLIADFPHYSNARLSLNIIHLPQLQLNPEEKIGTTYSCSLSTIRHILRNRPIQSIVKKNVVPPAVRLLWVYTLYTGTISSVDPRATLSFWMFSHKRDVSGENYNVNNPFWTLTLIAADSHLWGSQKRQNQISIHHPYKEDTHRNLLLCPGFRLSHSPPHYPQKDPLLANSPLPKLATPEEEMYSSLANLFLHTLIRITDLVMIASAVFSCKGDHVWQY